MGQTVTRRYGLPFKGYISSQARHTVAPDMATGDSYNWVLDPFEGKWLRRKGTGAATTSILENDFSAKGRQVVELRSESLDSGYPTRAFLLGNDDTVNAQLWFHNTNNNTGHVVGENFSATTYGPPTTTPAYRFWTVGCRNGGLLTTRGGTLNSAAASQLMRRMLLAGSRRVVQVGRWLLAPCFDAVPVRWSTRFNDSTSDAAEAEHLIPIGHMAPLFPPTATAGGGGATDGAWKANDQYFLSVQFVFEDGSVGPPFQPRPKQNSGLTAGLGLVTVPSASAYYKHVTYTNIAVGPPGTIKRRLLRSPKIDSSTTKTFPDPSDLRIIAEINNNNEGEQYVDYLGNDSALVADDALVRYDHVWPPRARYFFTFEHRVGAGYCRPNPSAIVFAPSGVSASRDLNLQDSSATLYSGTKLWYRLYFDGTTNWQFDLYKGATATSATYAAGDTIQSLVDYINTQTTIAAGTAEWVAQLVPNADPGSNMKWLAPTLTAVTGCTGSTTTVAATGPGLKYVAPGMFAYHATKIAANTYVTSVDYEGGTVTLSAAPTSALAAETVQFYVDDSDAAAPARGAVRCFGPAFPGILYFNRDWEDTVKTYKQDVWFTGGDPTHPPDAINSWYAGNRRSAPSEAGAFMGAAPLRTGVVLCYANAIYLLRNPKSGGTGLDEDYRVLPHNLKRGCISPYSIAWGDGWACYLTRDGLVVFDGDDERVISQAMYAPERATDKGEFEYEISQCLDAAKADVDGARFHVVVDGGRIYCSYRRSATPGDYALVIYDFSPSVPGSGLQEVLDAGAQPYGWSCPLVGPAFGALGRVYEEDGSHLYSIEDLSSGRGGYFEFEVGDDDDGSPIDALLYMATDLCETSHLKSARKAYAYYRKDGATIALKVSRDKARATLYTTTLASSGSNDFSRQKVELPLAARAPAEVVEFSVADDGSDASPSEWFGAEVEVELLDSEA